MVAVVMKARWGAHTAYRLAYHFASIPRYRRKVLSGDVAQRLEAVIGEICATRDWELGALTVQTDHVTCLGAVHRVTDARR
jgi:putative transposase